MESATDSIGCESDTESLAGSELVEEVLVERSLDFVVRQPQITAAFRDLDEVNLTTISAVLLERRFQEGNAARFGRSDFRVGAGRHSHSRERLETLLLVATYASGPPRSGRIGAQKEVGESV